MNTTVQDWYFQNDAVQSVYDYYQSGKTGNPLIAMPTGTGKSVVAAKLQKRILQDFPRQRLLCMTHVKELIKQNSGKLRDVWPNAPFGILSAGLKTRDTAQPIIFAGIATARNYVQQLGWRDVMIVDEAHLVSPVGTTMYQIFIQAMLELNPHFKVIGLSATPWRTGVGHLTNGGIFTDVCYDITGFEAFNRLIREGYLCPLVPKKTHNTYDTTGVHTTNGDFAKNELQSAVDKWDINAQVCEEMCELARDRESWLVFASGINHAEHLAENFNQMGIPTIAVHSKMGDDERDAALKAFRAHEVRCLVNNNVLTTGHDFPFLDFIGMCRPTKSAGLWVQMLGRGTRPYEGKNDCLVLDFAGNTRNLGPINDPVIPGGKNNTTGDVPIKLCPVCGTYHHTSIRECDQCGYLFGGNGGGRAVNLESTADTLELIRTEIKETPDVPIYSWLDVNRVLYSKHVKDGSPPVLKVSYICGLRVIVEWVHFEHPGYAKHKAHNWWRQRMLTSSAVEDMPETVDDVIRRERELMTPGRIEVWMNRRYPEVMKAENFRVNI